MGGPVKVWVRHTEGAMERWLGLIEWVGLSALVIGFALHQIRSVNKSISRDKAAKHGDSDPS